MRAVAMARLYDAGRWHEEPPLPPLPQWFLDLSPAEQVERWRKAVDRGDYDPCGLLTGPAEAAEMGGDSELYAEAREHIDGSEPHRAVDGEIDLAGNGLPSDPQHRSQGGDNTATAAEEVVSLF
jgi:hypothetical protein